MQDVMLDLETVGNGSKAAIVSIGAVVFNPLTGETGSEFYQPIMLSSSAYFGDMDASTVEWWMKQSDEARAVFSAENRVPLKDALSNLSDWLVDNVPYQKRTVWGNGATFDNVILANAYKATRIRQPWPYFGDRDVRTIVDLGRRLHDFDPKRDIPLQGTAHNALDDAKHQAIYVSAIYQRLQGHVKEAA